jgi:hypothetical protein
MSAIPGRRSGDHAVRAAKAVVGEGVPAAGARRWRLVAQFASEVALEAGRLDLTRARELSEATAMLDGAAALQGGGSSAAG